jgi:putative sigma-54 modulation protein
MKILIQGTSIELTSHLKQYIEDKVGSLEKFLKRFDSDIIEARVEVGKTKGDQRQGEIFRAEINLTIGGDLLRAEQTAESVQAAVDLVKDEMSDKIKHYKDKKETKTIRGARSWKKFWQISPFARFGKSSKAGRAMKGKEEE